MKRPYKHDLKKKSLLSNDDTSKVSSSVWKGSSPSCSCSEIQNPFLLLLFKSPGLYLFYIWKKAHQLVCFSSHKGEGHEFRVTIFLVYFFFNLSKWSTNCTYLAFSHVIVYLNQILGNDAGKCSLRWVVMCLS